jgi:hypothetical protein
LLDTVWLIICNTLLIDEEHFMAGIGVLAKGHLYDPRYKNHNKKVAKNALQIFLNRISRECPEMLALEIAYNAACNGRKDLVERALYAAFSK